MWRRLAQVLAVWISLVGLVPAALACAQVMTDHDCCPPGQQMPCDTDQGQVSIESAACCATSNMAPAAIKAIGEQGHGDCDQLPIVLDASWATLRSLELGVTSVDRRSGSDPPNISIDRSRTYLQTGRLRL